MKLNLLPKSAAKARGVGTAWVLSSLLALIGVGGAAFMIQSSQADLAKAQDAAAAALPKATEVVTIAGYADDIIQKATIYQSNTNLVHAMDNNIKKYPNFYDSLKKYIPSFFRVITLSPTPTGAGSTNLTITGIIKDQDQYNDLVLALMRIPGAANIQRQTIPHDDVIVPNVLVNDLNPAPYKASEGRPPADPVDRLNYLITKGGVTVPSGVDGFGSGAPGTRGAIPQQTHQVTVQLQMSGELQVPDVRGALAAEGGGAAAAAAGGGGGQAGNFGGGPGGPGGGGPGGPGGPGRGRGGADAGADG